MTRATLLLLLAALAITATTPLRPATGYGDGRTPPNASTRPLDAFLAFHAPSGGGGSTGPTAVSTPSAVVGSGLTSASGQEAGETTADGAGIGFQSVPSATSLDIADYARATPLVGFGGLHPIAESWSRGVAAGIASTVGSRFPDSYLALPIGPGFRVRIVGAGGSVTRVSTDAGPALYMQRPPYNRVADLSVHDFGVVCGVPVSLGLCQVSVTVMGRT